MSRTLLHRPRLLHSPDREEEYCNERVCLSVCLCVCLCVCLSTIISSELHQIFVHVTYGRGSVLLWRRSDTLCTSGFMDDAVFAHKPRLLNLAAQAEAKCTRSLGLGYKMCAVIPVAGQRTHGTTFRVLNVTSEAATPGAESAVYDCLVFLNGTLLSRQEVGIWSAHISSEDLSIYEELAQRRPHAYDKCHWLYNVHSSQNHLALHLLPFSMVIGRQ